jgi:hypothetical protein
LTDWLVGWLIGSSADWMHLHACKPTTSQIDRPPATALRPEPPDHCIRAVSAPFGSLSKSGIFPLLCVSLPFSRLFFPVPCLLWFLSLSWVSLRSHSFPMLYFKVLSYVFFPASKSYESSVLLNSVPTKKLYCKTGSLNSN